MFNKKIHIQKLTPIEKINKSKLALVQAHQFNNVPVKGIPICDELLLIPMIELGKTVEALFDPEFNLLFEKANINKLLEDTFKDEIKYSFDEFNLKENNEIRQRIYQIRTNDYFGTSLLFNQTFYNNLYGSNKRWLVLPSARNIFFLSPIEHNQDITLSALLLKNAENVALEDFTGKRIISKVFLVKELLNWEPVINE